MDDNMKNIVVLKDLPSNLVDEAIVIFKANVDMHKIYKRKENVKVTTKAKNINSDYVIKEAEMLVSNYISSIEKPKQLEMTNKILEKKYKKLKIASICFGILAVFGIIVNLI